MSGNWNVRVAFLADAAAIHQMMSDAREEIPLTARTFEGEAYLEVIRSDCRHRLWYVAVVDADVQPGGAMHLIGSNVFYLVADKRRRRNGAGRALLAHAKRKWSTLTAKTRLENTKALALLAAEGFVPDPHAHVGPGWLPFNWQRPRRNRR